MFCFAVRLERCAFQGLAAQKHSFCAPLQSEALHIKSKIKSKVILESSGNIEIKKNMAKLYKGKRDIVVYK